jgi:hypothetical protein
MSDIELGVSVSRGASPPNVRVDPAVGNPTYAYLEREEKVHGFLSRQFPTIANPAPLGLCAFALTTFILSMYNAGAASSKFLFSVCLF